MDPGYRGTSPLVVSHLATHPARCPAARQVCTVNLYCCDDMVLIDQMAVMPASARCQVYRSGVQERPLSLILK